MIYLLGIMTFFYVGLILFLLFGFHKIKNLETEGNSANISFSIVIAIRNETENLPQLFSSVKNLNYPISLYEIILVDDASEDDSFQRCENFKTENQNLTISVLKNKKIGKKTAIKTGIDHASKEYIITTDADCVLPKSWLSSFNDFIVQTNSKLIAGPIIFKLEKSFWGIFQQIDFLSLQGATIGGFGIENAFMCNAANLCFEKASFLNVDGFSGNEKIASGDDIFLLEKMRAANLKIGFLKNKKAIVETLPQPNFRKLINQRVRWAAKTSAYKNGFGKLVGIVVFLANLAFAIGAFLLIFNLISQQTFLIFFLFKFNVDFLLIHKSAQFFSNEKILNHYFWCSFLYPFFSSYVGMVSLFSKFDWKGRQFSK